MTAPSHDAIPVRRLRGGMYHDYAACPCGWAVPTHNRATAVNLAARHNLNPGSTR